MCYVTHGGMMETEKLMNESKIKNAKHIKYVPWEKTTRGKLDSDIWEGATFCYQTESERDRAFDTLGYWLEIYGVVTTDDVRGVNGMPTNYKYTKTGWTSPFLEKGIDGTLYTIKVLSNPILLPIGLSF